MRYGELFAGAGGMSLGLERAGMACAFHAEIADFPRRVLKHRWPDTPLYGDVAQLDGHALVATHGPIDLLAGGSPCQDLSVAGKRAGLGGARSGLFYQQLRLWEETGATYLLWENVAGALSSNNGKDFAAVLSAIVGATVVVPRDGWGGDESGGGVAAGPRAVAAWRLLDAQYFGVPQRRLRVFVLGARAGGVDPAEVLLEPEGVRRHPPARGEAGEGTADGVGVGVARTLVAGGRETGPHGSLDGDNLVVSFRNPPTRGEAGEGTPARAGDGATFAFRPTAAGTHGVEWGEVCPAIKVGSGLDIPSPPGVLAFHQTQDPISDAERSLSDKQFEGTPCSRCAGTVRWKADHSCVACSKARQHQRMIARYGVTPEQYDAMLDSQGGVCAICRQPCNKGQKLAVDHDHASGRARGLLCDRCNRGLGYFQDDPSLAARAADYLGRTALGTTTGGMGVLAYDTTQVTSALNRSNPRAGDPCHPLAAQAHAPLVVAFDDPRRFNDLHGGGEHGDFHIGINNDSRGAWAEHAAPLRAGERSAPSVLAGIPRRLMPVECCRLMSWPDTWLDVPDEKGKMPSDAVKYKAAGNGVVSNVAEWIASRLIALEEAAS